MANKEIKIIALGDICPGDHYFSLGHGVRSSFEKYGLNFIFSKVKGLISTADIAFCNLEGVISDAGLDCDLFESFAFRGLSGTAESLKSAGFSVVNIANNHIMQHGEAAFTETIESLKNNGLTPLGFKTVDGYSSQPVIKEVHGAKIGFLGYSMVPESYSPADIPYALSPENDIIADIKRLRPSVDFVIVSCHFGTEAINHPSPSGIIFAHNLIDAGADVLLGHHPHVFQPAERYRNGLILYSLGNFVSDFFWDSRYCSSGIAEIRLRNPGPSEVTVHPVRVNRSCQPELYESREEHVRLNNISNYAHEKEFARNELQNLSYYSEVFKLSIYLSFKKVLYFILYLPFGRTRLKAGFLLRKISSRITRRSLPRETAAQKHR